MAAGLGSSAPLLGRAEGPCGGPAAQGREQGEGQARWRAPGSGEEAEGGFGAAGTGV